MKHIIALLIFMALVACGGSGGSVGGGNTATNDTPPIIRSEGTHAIPEGSPIGTLIVAVEANGQDGAADAPLTYRLSDTTYMQISSNGEVRTAAELDYATAKRHTAVLTVSDGVFEVQQTITLFVQPVLDIAAFPPITGSMRQGIETFVQHEAAPEGYGDVRFTTVSQSDARAEFTPTNNTDIGEVRVRYDSGDQTTLRAVYSFMMADGIVFATTGSITIEVALRDPLYEHQWHLKNTGQKAFSDHGGTVGADINVEAVHRQNILGAGVKVAVVDTGLEIGHEDLQANVEVGKSYDFVNSDDDPTLPHNPDDPGDHGTSVAGIIAMRGWNEVGGTGVAPEARLRGYNLLSVDLENYYMSYDMSYAASLGYAEDTGIEAHSEEVDIFNMSFGRTPEAYAYGHNLYLEVDTMRCGTTGKAVGDYDKQGYFSSCDALRDGKGAIYVKAAGNGFESTAYDCDEKYSCAVVNGNEIEGGHPFVMNIGALNADDEKTVYSSAGAALWVSAPGGNYGLGSAAFGTSGYYWPSRNRPAMVTTDQSGCNQGYTSERDPDGFPLTGFHGTKVSFYSLNYIDPHPLNENCNYASTFNGTSSAAPVVSGVVALMLSENPDLTWRDVRYILAKTTRQVDADIPSEREYLSGGYLVMRPGWQTNRAGFAFHPWYGFGAVDAAAAVEMAKNYLDRDHLTNETFVEGEWQTGSISRNSIKDWSLEGATGEVQLSGVDMDWIEGVQVRVSLDHDAVDTDLNIRLTAPSSTQSMILRAANTLSPEGLDDVMFYTNAFYREEEINGEWKIEVIDSELDILVDPGTLTDWKLRIFGHNAL